MFDVCRVYDVMFLTRFLVFTDSSKYCLCNGFCCFNILFLFHSLKNLVVISDFLLQENGLKNLILEDLLESSETIATKMSLIAVR